MPSNIDASVPPEGHATTAAVRNNFLEAKTEIEALQLDVSDNATAIATKQDSAVALDALSQITPAIDTFPHFTSNSDAASLPISSVGKAVVNIATIRDLVSYLQLNNFAGLPTRNLVITNGGAFPDVHLTITAAELTVFDASGFGHRLTSVNVTCAMDVLGVNGRDTGSEAASTWYYVYVIWNGTTVASLFSTSATSPVLPSGYTFFRRVGSIYNNASSNLRRIRQVQGKVRYTESLAALNGAVTSNAWTAVSIASLVPPTAIQFPCIIGTDSDEGVLGLAAYSSGHGGFISAASRLNTGPNNNLGSLLLTSVRAAATGMVQYSGDLYYYFKPTSGLIQVQGWDES